MASVFTGGRFQAINAAGVVPGALVYTYAAGTLSPLATFTDQGGLSSNRNPVECDANGMAAIWFGTNAYRIIVKTALGVVISDDDNLTSGVAAADLSSAASAILGAGMVGFDYSKNYVASTVGWALRQGAINLAWFTGFDPAGVTDNAAIVGAAIALIPATGGAIYGPGLCKLASTVTVNKPCLFFGPGQQTTVVQCGFITSHPTADMFQITSSGVSFQDLTFSASVTRTAGYHLNFNSAVNNNNSYVRRCTFSGHFSGIGLTGASTTAYFGISDCTLTTVINGGTGVQISTAGPSVDLVLDNVLIAGGVGNMALGVNIVNAGDITLKRVSTIQCAVGLSLVPTTGKAVQACLVSDCFFDTGLSYGINAAPAAGGTIQLLKVVNTWACSNAHGIILSLANTGLVQRVELINVTACNNTAGAGIYIGGSTVTDTLIQGGSVAANTNGVYVVAGADKIVINGLRAGPSGQFAGNTAYGINLLAGATTNVTIVGCDLAGNTSGAIFDGATGGGKSIAYNNGFGYGSATYDPASLVDGAGATTTVTVTGAVVGDMVSVSFSQDLQGITLTGWVSAANTVSVRFQNESGGTLDLASGSLRASLTRRT